MTEKIAHTLDRRTFVRAALATGGALASGFLLAGCGRQEADSPAEPSDPADSTATPVADPASAPLVIYFSCPEPTGTDTVAGASRVVVDGELFGNIEYVATLIAERTGADVFAIETVQEYPADHDELIEFAVAEMDAGTLPELSTPLVDLAAYDTVYLGYPIWNALLPMPVRTVLESADLAGKTVVCFTVHGGSGFGGTIAQVEQAAPEASVVEGFSISRNDVGEAAPEVDAWLDEWAA